MLKRVCFYLLTIALIFSLHTGARAQGERKVAYTLLVDNTGSMRSQIDQILYIAKGIVGRTHSRGPVSIFRFEGMTGRGRTRAEATGGTEWSQERDLLEEYLDSIFIVPGQTTLFDALNTMAVELDAVADKANDPGMEKIIFIITDGEERESKISEKQLLERLKRSGIKVYAVGLVNELNKNSGIISKSGRGEAVKLLERIAAETGGRAVFPGKKETNAEALLKELFATPIP